jgi:branched-chain amino acid transport system ATP-binding protein
VTTLLSVSNLSVKYGDVAAATGIELTVGSGEVSLVLGANGAGKTSTLRGIAGLERPSSGVVLLEDRDVAGKAAYRIARLGLALIPEGRRTFSPLTIEDNLLLGAYVERSKKRRKEILASVYEMFPILGDRRSGRAGLLSGGEQQMLAFGRALMSSPKVILMDEPSMGLSPAMVDETMLAVRGMANSGVGILMVEQNARAALAVSDHAIVIARGEIVVRGDASALMTDDAVVRAFLGEKSNDSEPMG